MEIGCHLPNQGPLATGEAVATFAREADRRGVASLWVSDHVSHILLEFRRDDLGRILEILELVTGTVRPAVDRA